MSKNKYRYRAFLSYASRYRDWVAVLHRNLEAVLGKGTVFIDQRGLAPGESGPSRLQRAAEDSERIILIGTPEALASPWVLEELESQLVHTARDWGRGRILPLKLVDTHWPPFLNGKQWLDFENALDETYRDKFGKLLTALGETAQPEQIEIPPTVEPDLDPGLRRELVELLAEPLANPIVAGGLEQILKLNAGFLSAFPSKEMAASAALFHTPGVDSPVVACERLLEIVRRNYAGLMSNVAERVERISVRLESLPKTKSRSPILERYLDYVRRRCLELPTFIGRKARNAMLEHVFVQLRLGLERGGSEKRREASWMHAPMQLSELLDLTDADDPSIRGRWAIRGVPGAGKSTILRQYAGKLAEQAMREGDSRIPLFVSLPDWTRECASLLDYMEQRASRVREDHGLGKLLDQLGDDGRLVVMFDGFDEVAGKYRDGALDLIRETSSRWKSSTVVVASRPIGYVRPSHSFLELDVQPLDRGRREELLANWFKEPGAEPDWKRAKNCVDKLEADPRLWELSEIPLYLTWMAILFDSDEDPSPQRHRLYDQILDRLYERKYWSEDAKPLPMQTEADQALQRLAIEWTREGVGSEPFPALCSRMLNDAYDAIRARLDIRPEWTGNPRRFLESVAETGVLGPYDGEEEDWRFWHKSFLEALTAKALERRFARSGMDGLLQRAQSIAGDELARWAEPYALLAGRIDHADELVLALTEVNRPLGLRALATAQGLQPETLTRILGLTENLKQRSEVIGQVADHVGDSERAILLLDQIGAQAADGNDLHFVHESLQRIADSDPGCEESVQAKQACLYANPRVDDETLFRTIRTHENKSVSLWAEIPDGRFWMGSLDGGRLEWVSPQHEVELSAFRAAIVPVTVAQFHAFDPDHNPYFRSRFPDDEFAYHPVVNVTWYEAVSFCRWLSQQFEWASGARLPTEAEWEYLCRAGTITKWWCGDYKKALSKVAWFGEGWDYGTTYPVAHKQANSWGLYDVHGNVWEWCQDWFADSHPGTDRRTSPTGPETGSFRAIRGGSFRSDAEWLRSACRSRRRPGNRSHDQGFRVVLPAAQ